MPSVASACGLYKQCQECLQEQTVYLLARANDPSGKRTVRKNDADPEGYRQTPAVPDDVLNLAAAR